MKSAGNAEQKLRSKLRKENDRNKRIDGSLCIHMHAYTYKSTQRYMHMYLCVNQTKVTNLDLFFQLLRL